MFVLALHSTSVGGGDLGVVRVRELLGWSLYTVFLISPKGVISLFPKTVKYLWPVGCAILFCTGLRNLHIEESSH